MHGFLSRDGLPPQELLEVGREEVRGYGGDIVDSTVTDLGRAGSDFQVRLTNGAALTARRLLVATGLRDELPDVPGVRERFGRQDCRPMTVDRPAARWFIQGVGRVPWWSILRISQEVGPMTGHVRKPLRLPTGGGLA